MPGFNGKGPRGSGRSGRGMRQGMGVAGNASRQRRGQRNLDDFVDPDFVENAMRTHPYIYQYSLEELKERKQELEKEIQWLNDRIKELETAK